MKHSSYRFPCDRRVFSIEQCKSVQKDSLVGARHGKQAHDARMMGHRRYLSETSKMFLRKIKKRWMPWSMNMLPLVD